MTLTQRQPPPFNRAMGRYGEPVGGPPPASRPRTLAHLLNDQTDRYPGYSADDQIQRDRAPTFHHEWSNSGRSTGLVDWTAAGPVRAELRMKNITLRTMQGNTRTRNMPDPKNFQRGIHTNPPAAQVTAGGRYDQTQQMLRPRQFRLRSGQYSGQSFSETTQIQGGSLRGKRGR